MKLFLKVVFIYALFATLIALLLGIYKVFELSILAGVFFTGIYVFSIASIVMFIFKFLEQLKEKIQPLIKKLEKLKKWFKWLK